MEWVVILTTHGNGWNIVNTSMAYKAIILYIDSVQSYVMSLILNNIYFPDGFKYSNGPIFLNLNMSFKTIPPM